MRTTVTLDPDVERLLKEEAHRTRQSFKMVLNNAVRSGLKSAAPHRRKPYAVKAQPLHLRAGIDPAELGDTADELEVEAFLDTTKRLLKKVQQ